MERAAVVLRVKPDREDAYRAWLEGSAGQLGEVYARNGIRAKTVLMAGPRFIAHYEADRNEGVLSARAEPESVAIVKETSPTSSTRWRPIPSCTRRSSPGACRSRGQSSGLGWC